MQCPTLPIPDLLPNQIPAKEALHTLEEFNCGEPPPMSSNLPEELLRPANDTGYSYEEWINLLKNDHNRILANSLKLWEWSPQGKLIGLGSGGRTLFKTIARRIRSFHSSSYFCGDLYNRVRIFVRPDLSVSLPFAPILDIGKLEKGVTADMVHFRFLVAFLIKTVKIKYNELPEDFIYFFSRLFTRCSRVKNRREACFLQFCHPIFFDSQDRINFMQAVVDYRKKNISYFEWTFGLWNEVYDLHDWDTKICQNPHFLSILDFENFRKSTMTDKWSYYSAIPRYIRNVHSHYSDYDSQKSRQSFEQELNECFPGICSKIFDVILALFDHIDGRNCGKFYAILNDRSRGFHSEGYSPNAF